MSTTCRVGIAAMLLGLALPSGLAPAQAADQDARPEVDRKAATRKSPAPGDTKGAEVVKAGWWWLVNEPPPETGLLAAPQAPTPATPKSSLPVGAVGGDAEKVSAVEVRLDAETGDTVRKLTMVLRESDEPGANANAESARIVACPVTELFWADGSAAAWKDRPTYDCEAGKAVGKRTHRGWWRFDLTDIAAGWLAEDNTSSHSVVLVEDVEAPESFQVALDGPKDEGVGLALKAVPAVPLPDPGDGEDRGPSGSTSAGVGSGGGGTSGLGTTGAGGGSLGGTDVPLAEGAQPRLAADAAPVAADQGKRVALAPVAAPPAWYSGIPRGGFLLALLALGLAYLIMVSLGPDARPLPATGRHGVSRALDRLRQAGRDLRTGR